MVQFGKHQPEQAHPNPSSLVRSVIVAEEEDDTFVVEEDDIIPGPATSIHVGFEVGAGGDGPNGHHHNGNVTFTQMDLSKSRTTLDESNRGGMASRKDLSMPSDEFAEGCKLLQQAALGNQKGMEAILAIRPHFVNFRDYDRRTALHVAASEGHLESCMFLIGKGAKKNRSDRWGGSPLDDAHRHRHQAIIQYLRSLGCKTGSTNNLTNFIAAAAEGDVDEVRHLLAVGDVDINQGDYDQRTALHLSSGEGRESVVMFLLEQNADVNVEDRWGFRPLDDALGKKHQGVAKILQSRGARKGAFKGYLEDSSRKREIANLNVEFKELEMIDRIGKGSFGEIYKCRWRGTLVAAKCIKSASIKKVWLRAKAMEKLAAGDPDAEDALGEIDDMDGAEMTEAEKEAALLDFRQEVSVLKALRHPNIVLLLGYSQTKDMEVMISELMKCSLLDILKANIIHNTKMKKKDQIVYATHLAQGMLYLHLCRPPVIHRDLKPANLLIDHSGVLKVADFGLSKIRPDPKTAETESFLMTGETGSYRFMAPEVYKHQPYTEKVDVYSYGMILYYLLEGKPPWAYENGLVAVRKAADEGDRPILPRNWDQRLQNLIQECWHEDPQVRPPFDKILKSLNEYSRK